MAEITQNPPAGSKKLTSPSGAPAGNPFSIQETASDIWSWAEKNVIVLAAGLGILIVGAIGMATMNWWQGRNERQAQEAYYSVEAKFNKTKEGFDRAKLQAMMPQLTKERKVDTKPASGDLEKDYGSIITDLEKVALNHPGSAASAQAAILASDTYLSYNKPDKAIELTQKVARDLSDKTLLGGLVRVQMGSAYANKGDCKEAIKVWSQVLENKTAAFLHPDASLRSGLCFETMNEPQKAMEMYRKVSSDAGADSPAAATAKGLLRALEVKSNAASAPAKQG